MKFRESNPFLPAVVSTSSEKPNAGKKQQIYRSIGSLNYMDSVAANERRSNAGAEQEMANERYKEHRPGYSIKKLVKNIGPSPQY